jgi:hypothetical protein
MGAMPTAGHRNEGEKLPRVWCGDRPVAAPRREVAAWGYFVHPALMPTVFVSTGSAPVIWTLEEVAVRRV